MCGNSCSLISALALIRLPLDARQRAPAVGAARGAHPTGADLAAVVEERLAGARVDVAPHLPRAAELVALRAAPIRDDLAHRDGDGVADLDAGVVGAARHRLAFGRIQAAALRYPQVDAIEEALVLRDRRVDEAGKLRDDVAAGVAECRPRVDVRAGVRSFEVDDQAIALDGDRDVHVDVVVARRIGVDVHVGLVGAVGPARDLRGEPPGRVARSTSRRRHRRCRRRIRR